MSNNTTLITASTGKTGRRVAALLRERGLEVREGSRRSEIPFDWEDSATWPAALEHVSVVYVVHPDLGSAEARDQMREFARVAAAAGVRRAVMVSVPDVGGMDVPIVHATEESFPEAGIPVTVLRLRWFFQNFSEDFLLEPTLSGNFRLPTGDGREAFVDADDIAEVAVAALTDDAHTGADYEVTGPETLSFEDIARTLSTATGRDITFEAISIDEFVAENIAAGVPEEWAHALGGIYAAIAPGNLDSISSDVEKVLGKPARTFADFAEANAELWRR